MDVVCKVKANKEPTVSWKKGSTTLSSSPPYTITTTACDSSKDEITTTLKISYSAALNNDMTCTASGTSYNCQADYTCEGSNTVLSLAQKETSQTKVTTKLGKGCHYSLTPLRVD